LKLTGVTTCPGCKEKHKVEFDLDKLDVPAKTAQTTNTQATGQTTIQEIKPQEPKIEIKTVIEDFKPNYECPDGNCDIGVHKNKNFKKRPKGKCTNCDQFTKHESGTCPWCKGTDIDALDPEELDDLGITPPIQDEHEGHDHD